MRITDELRSSVVFLGYAEGPAGISAVGTAFLIAYAKVGYLVTARHISHQLGSDPFLMRVNRKDGGSENLPVDGCNWFEHSDETVDLAMVPLHIGRATPFDCAYMFAENLLVTDEKFAEKDIGVGSTVYTIGLFRLLSGKKRNMPICFTGSVAMLPGDERIPLVDWRDPTRRKRIFVEGYLIQSQSLSGLSGSPVLVRPSVNMDFTGLMKPPPEKSKDNGAPQPTITASLNELFLLGIWQGAWEAPPDEVMAAESGRAVVPMGTGIVVPAQRLLELFEQPEVRLNRETILEARKSSRPTEDILIPQLSPSPT